MKYVFIINPKAGTEDNEQLIRNAVSELAEKDQCSFLVTRCQNDAEGLVREHCTAHPGEEVRLIACGGDGTLNEVINGAVGFENVSVTCYPCGSGNDFVKAFGGAEKFLHFKSLMHAPSRRIDLLKEGDRYSMNVINFGFDTTVAMTINEERAKTGKAGGQVYAKGVMKALLTAMNNSFRVSADGEVLNPDGKALLCTLANGQYVGGSFRCAPKSEPDDGMIDVCLIKPISRLRFVTILDTYTNGGHLDDPKMQDIIVYRRAKKVQVDALPGFAYSLDGEIVYKNHFTVEIVPQAIDFAVPE